MGLSSLLFPFSKDEFLENVHEQKELWIKRDNSSYFNNVLSFRELSEYLDKNDIRYPSLRVVKNGFEIDKKLYEKKAPVGYGSIDVIDNNKVFSLFNDGATIVIQAGQRYFNNLGNLCLDLNNLFGCPVQANIYITPKNSQGFIPHWDTHDVFVLQIEGTKVWKLYKSDFKLPTRNQNSKDFKLSDEIIDEFEIQAGDLLYIPRGLVHDAVSTDKISAHITLGVLSYNWQRLFSNFTNKLESNVEFRKSIPFWDKEKLIEQLERKISLFKEEIKNDKHWDILLNEFDKLSGQTRINTNKDRLLSYKAVETINLDTKLKIVNRLNFNIQYNDDSVIITFQNKIITLPNFSKRIISEMIEKEYFSLSELDENIDTNGKLFLSKKLISEGLLEM